MSKAADTTATKRKETQEDRVKAVLASHKVIIDGDFFYDNLSKEILAAIPDPYIKKDKKAPPRLPTDSCMLRAFRGEFQALYNIVIAQKRFDVDPQWAKAIALVQAMKDQGMVE